jgi:hypothetical protein
LERSRNVFEPATPIFPHFHHFDSSIPNPGVLVIAPGLKTLLPRRGELNGVDANQICVMFLLQMTDE